MCRTRKPNLAKDVGAADATCEALGAGTYWDRLVDEASVLRDSVPRDPTSAAA